MKQLRSVLLLSVRQLAVIAASLLPLAALAVPPLSDTPPPSGQAKMTASGEQTYTKWCAECHASVIGPGTQALQRKYQGQVPAILHQRTGLPAELVKYAVRHGMGFMPPFRKTEISNSELASLATYLASVDPESAKQGGPAQ
jgi:mono/diheme cytochrome c family protein